MSVTAYKADGTPVAGDPELTDAMRAYADREGGYVADDDTGATVYVAGQEAEGD